MLKQIALYSSEYSNPCLTEYLPPRDQERVKRAWTNLLNGEEGESPVTFQENYAYHAASKNLLEVSYNPDENYFQAMTGHPSRYCDAALPDSPSIPPGGYLIIGTVAAVVLVVIIAEICLIMGKKSFQNNNDKQMNSDDSNISLLKNMES